MKVWENAGAAPSDDEASVARRARGEVARVRGTPRARVPRTILVTELARAGKKQRMPRAVIHHNGRFAIPARLGRRFTASVLLCRLAAPRRSVDAAAREGLALDDRARRRTARRGRSRGRGLRVEKLELLRLRGATASRVLRRHRPRPSARRAAAAHEIPPRREVRRRRARRRDVEPLRASASARLRRTDATSVAVARTGAEVRGGVVRFFNESNGGISIQARDHGFDAR